MASDTDIAAVILALVAQRGAGKSICPSEAARAVGKAIDAPWRDLMPDVRQVASGLQSQGLIRVTQKGETVDLSLAHGPVRLSHP